MATNYGIISRLATSRKILLQQLKDQGYDVSSYENFTFSEVNVLAQNKQQDIICREGQGIQATFKYAGSSPVTVS